MKKVRHAFEIGDKVMWCGRKGVVVSIEVNKYGDTQHPLQVAFSKYGLHHFTMKGKFWYWHKEQSLTLVTRKKKK